MIYYIIRRISMIIPLLLGISLVTFLVIHLSPGGYQDINTSMNIEMDSDARSRLQKLYGLDEPFHIQYFNWLKRMILLDFGRSFKDNRLVIVKIAERLPATLLLNIPALLLIFVISLPLGILAAVKQNSIYDRSITIFVFLGFSIPIFWLALMLRLLLGVHFNILPISGMRSVIGFDNIPFYTKIWDILKHMVLPVSLSAFGGLAGIVLYSRASMLEIIRKDYIRTARAKGLNETQVICKHAFRNALIPIVTLMGLALPGLIGGSFIFETIFAWPGIGRLGYEAIMSRDYPVIMGIGIITAFLTLLGNLFADIAYAYVDPRIRYTKR